MKRFLALLALTLLAQPLYLSWHAGAILLERAQENPNALRHHVIYNIEHELPLKGDGSKIIKNFYIQGGNTKGIKTGDTYTVYRRHSSYHLIEQQFFQDTPIPVGTITIKSTDQNLSIATIDSIFSPQEGFVIHPRAVIVGDYITTLATP